MRKTMNAYGFGGKAEGKRLLGRLRRRWGIALKFMG
jgi:hypothetical protein